MLDTLTPYRSRLLQSKYYAAGPVFIENTQWQHEYNGHVLSDVSTGGNLVGAIVGRVLKNRLSCGPNGNYVNATSDFLTLATSKYGLQLGRPIGTPFELDYDKVLENVGILQAQVASTNERLNFVATDGGDRILRFSRKVFQKRVRPCLSCLTVLPFANFF